MTFSKFLTVLKARRLSALVVLISTVALTIAASLLLTKQYTATAALVVDVRSPDPIAGMVLGAMTAPAYMATQVDIITSARISRQVVRTLKLTENDEARRTWLEATEGRGDFEAWLATRLADQLRVQPSRVSNVINISYTNPDPRFAAALANAFVAAYLDVSINLRTSPAKQYTEFFDARANEIKTSLERAQAKLTVFQKSSGILASEERFDIETQRLNELASQLVALQAISSESTSRTAQARHQADELYDVINNPVVASLRGEASRQEARLQELTARFGEAHPQVVELRASIGSLKQRIDTETKRVSGSVGVTNTINKQREAETRAALEAQRSRVLALKQQRDEASVLTKEVETAQRAYDQVVNRSTQSSLESQNTQTNISVLTPATEPAAPSSPRLLLNVVLSLFLGGLLAIGIALLRELMDRRVRKTDDLAQVLGIPILGTLPKPLAQRGAKGGALLLPAAVLGRLPRPSR